MDKYLDLLRLGIIHEASKIAFLISICAALLVVAGCVGVKNKRTDPAWPKAAAIKSLKQFDGVFQNFSVETKIDKVSCDQLFDFLINQSHSHLKRGTDVEIKSSPDETSLHLRLLAQDKSEIDSADLHRDVDFDLSRDSINLHSPYLGRHVEAGNIAMGRENQRSELYVSSTGSEKTWVLWPKRSQSPLN